MRTTNERVVIIASTFDSQKTIQKKFLENNRKTATNFSRNYFVDLDRNDLIRSEEMAAPNLIATQYQEKS